ncbi:MAG: right-handed parallel beta-helix repeat-containing protein [Candidatus Aminicenantes bacterium]|nr:right-handed parallel beta-helix repeat-containing protein [Candidatus Aminicenantes bacterium]
MKKLRVCFSLGLTLVLFLVASVSSQAAVLRVPDNYATIQAAVANAQSGDIIQVSAGVYSGQVIVDKSISIKGDGAESTFLEVNPNENGFVIIADDVSISGFTISGATAFQHSGIIIGGEYPGDTRYSIGYATISKCTIQHNCSGIYIWKAHDCMVVNNVIRHNEPIPVNVDGGTGIIVWEGPSTDNSFVNNEINYNFKYGLFIGGGTPSSYAGSKVTANTFYRNGTYSGYAGQDRNWLAIGFMNANGKIMVSGNKIFPTTSGLDVWIYNSPDVKVTGNPVYKAKGPHVPIPTGY